MLNKVKELFTSDKVVRDTSEMITECYIDQLTKEDLTLEQKQKIAAETKELVAEKVKWEEKNTKWWYEYGRTEGTLRGYCLAAGVIVVSYTIGALLRKR